VSRHQRAQGSLDELALPVEHVDLIGGDLTVNLQRQVAFGHAREHRVDPADVGHARIAVGRGARRVELAPDHETAVAGPVDLLGGGAVSEVERH
jgi:hypothetical protein